MKTRQIDPRDEAWQVKSPRYRVYFWSRRNGGWASDEWELEATDVSEALNWAKGNAAGRDFALYASIPAESDRVGLIKLSGLDPTAM